MEMEKKPKTRYNKIPISKEPEEAIDIKEAVEERAEFRPEKKPEWGTATVAKCQNLNLRSEPSMTASVIKTIKAGTDVQVDEDFKSNEWTKVRYFGDNGYVMSKYLER